MNGTMPARDRSDRGSTPRRASGPARAMPGSCGLVGGVANPESGAETRKAAGVKSGGRRDGALSGSAFDRIAAFPVLSLCGYDGQAQLLAEGPADEPANAVGLPPSRLHQILQRYASRALHQVEDFLGFAPLAGILDFLGFAPLADILLPGSLRQPERLWAWVRLSWPLWASSSPRQSCSTSPRTSRPGASVPPGLAFVLPVSGASATTSAVSVISSLMFVSPCAAVAAVITSITRLPPTGKRILREICVGEHVAITASKPARCPQVSPDDRPRLKIREETGRGDHHPADAPLDRGSPRAVKVVAKDTPAMAKGAGVRCRLPCSEKGCLRSDRLRGCTT